MDKVELTTKPQKFSKQMSSRLSTFRQWAGSNAKKIWNFLPQVIPLVTIVLAVATIVVQQQQFNKHYESEQQRFIERHKFEQEQLDERYQKEKLIKYFSDIKELSLVLEKENPSSSQEKNRTKNLARAITINTLDQLDEENKKILVSFLIESNLVNNVNKSDSSLPGSSLSDSNSIISLSKANLGKVKLPRVDLSGADLSGADLSGADLSGANLTGANLTGADLSEAVLTKAHLTKASLRYAELKKARLENTDLTEARLREANLTEAELMDSDLNKANLVGAILEKANLKKANLESTDLVGANLNDAILNEAILKKADMLGTTVVKADFKGVQGLNSVKHLSRRQLNSAKNTNNLINKDLDSKLQKEKQEGEGFICGPYTDTYAVRFLSKPEIVGVRCLLKTNANTESNFVWYGEDSKTQSRHIGQAFFTDSTSGDGYISELGGDNENQKTPSKSIVKMTIVSKKVSAIDEFKVENKTTKVIEKWTLEKIPKNYELLKETESTFNCGKDFDKYKVYPIVTRRRINSPISDQFFKTDWGLRCVYKGNETKTWFGTGKWEGRPYYHLGTKMNDDNDGKDKTKGYGAVDLCGFQQNAYCYEVKGGLLELNHLQNDDFEIKQEWSEKWLKQE